MTQEQKDYNMNFDDELEEAEIYDLDDSKNSSKDIKDEKKCSNKLVAKDMLIADVVEEHPELVPMIMDYGVHCVGCGAAMFETLEEGFMGHGMVDEEIDTIVTELNDYIKSNSKENVN